MRPGNVQARGRADPAVTGVSFASPVPCSPEHRRSIVTVKDYYRVLGVRRAADDAAIKAAFRRMARRCHPDVARSKRDARRFPEIVESYEFLSDPERRRHYDRAYHDRRATSRTSATSARFKWGDRAANRSGPVEIALDVLRLGVRLAVDVELNDEGSRRKPDHRQRARPRLRL